MATGDTAALRPASLEARGVRSVLGGVLALDGVDLQVESGRCVALVGESGAGKTTLLRCFNRMVVPSAARDGSWNLVVFPSGFRRLRLAGSRAMHPRPPA